MMVFAFSSNKNLPDGKFILTGLEAIAGAFTSAFVAGAKVFDFSASYIAPCRLAWADVTAPVYITDLHAGAALGESPVSTNFFAIFS